MKSLNESLNLNFLLMSEIKVIFYLKELHVVFQYKNMIFTELKRKRIESLSIIVTVCTFHS